MNSFSHSKRQLNDSLTPPSSFLLSESEQTEDEAEVFSSEGEGENGSRGKSSFTFAFTGHSDRPCCRSDNDQAECRSVRARRPASAHSPEAITLDSPSVTPGDMAFAQKCADLHRFVRPLLELLNGLKTGRFHRGLSSFQQSVAMDRLQRILGILQKPDMGEKYLRTLLQVEMMLKVWFPQVAVEPLVTAAQSNSLKLPSRWRQNQLHIPVKKRKLSWSDSDPLSSVSPPCKRYQQGKLEMSQTVTSHNNVSTCQPVACQEGNARPEKDSCTSGHSLTESTGTSNMPSDLCNGQENGDFKQLEIPPPSPCDNSATQDCSVSSSSTFSEAELP
ncbi:circadian associated repressor of transcription a [Lampris incognitus]|uniref:circadian associated repressor of transcription a n=1 Tax=Lampris incognitus TaxID=2546036 RepID=UPI0024B6053B|nr:circadian associated repressor of transcription a [Lampris incognitus]